MFSLFFVELTNNKNTLVYKVKYEQFHSKGCYF